MLVHLVRTNTKDMDGACTLISMDGLIHGPGAVLDVSGKLAFETESYHDIYILHYYQNMCL